jgi:hypothetical protein
VDRSDGKSDRSGASDRRFGILLAQSAIHSGGIHPKDIMSQNDSQPIVITAWNFAHILRDDGLSYMAYTEQIEFLLFLKTADEHAKPPYNKLPIVPPNFGWTGYASPPCTHAWLFAARCRSFHPQAARPETLHLWRRP